MLARRYQHAVAVFVTAICPPQAVSFHLHHNSSRRPSMSLQQRHSVNNKNNGDIILTASESDPTETMATAKPVWDVVNGVWANNKAAVHQGEIPSPLWIFGYGSLCWRPEDCFEGFETMDGEIVGWTRLFAQKSMDHRGTPQFPGLVATVIADAELEALGSRSAGDPPSRTHGLAYRVPDDKVEAVLSDLDFREKGGYTRAVVDVFPPVGTVPPIKALLYTASTDNPNFFMAETAEEAAATIAAAVGPSGPNYEYLFFLSEFLQEVGRPDDHVTELTDLVRARMDATNIQPEASVVGVGKCESTF